jgi:RNA polymerase primary sigma factor
MITFHSKESGIKPKKIKNESLNDPVDEYLKGRLPLLSREDELKVAKNIHDNRQVFKRACLCNEFVLEAAIITLERVQRRGIRLDWICNVDKDDGDKKIHLRRLLEPSIKSLRDLQSLNKKEFEKIMQPDFPAKKRVQAWGKLLLRRQHMAALVEEFNFKVDILDSAQKGLKDMSKRMLDIKGRLQRLRNSPIEMPEKVGSLRKELNGLMRTTGETPATLKRRIDKINQWEEKYIASKKIMTRSNLLLVVDMAGKYLGRGLSMFDLIQDGNRGLLHAVDRFDHKRGFKFGTFATWWIRREIQLGIKNEARQSKLGNLKTISLSSNIEGEDFFSDSLEDTRRHWGKLEGDLEFDENADALKKIITDILHRVSERDRQIIIRRFGLDGQGEHTLKEVGAEFKVTRERIRQIEARALNILRGEQNKLRLLKFIA